MAVVAVAAEVAAVAVVDNCKDKKKQAPGRVPVFCMRFLGYPMVRPEAGRMLPWVEEDCSVMLSPTLTTTTN